MIKKYLGFCLFMAVYMLGAYQSVKAQRVCGHQLIKDNINSREGGAAFLAQRYAMYEQTGISSYTAPVNGSRPTSDVIKIPVVFHVLLTAGQIQQMGGPEGIIARIHSQMEVLNEDYNRLNKDSISIPSYFKPYYTSANLFFGLAHTNPQGNRTEGYTIDTVSTTSFSGANDAYPAAKYAANGGVDAWNTRRYLNIWVISMRESEMLGVAIPPSFAASGMFSQSEIGVVINFKTLGRRENSAQYFMSGFDKGRTLTHELAHYFELEHVFGNNSSCPGSGDIDDGIADTPPQGPDNSGNPSTAGPLLDNCTTSGNGVMFMNFLDYVNDSSMNMFTTQQCARMRLQLQSGQNSYELGMNPELLEYPAGVDEVDKQASKITVSPIPSPGEITVSFNKVTKATIDIYDNVGKLIMSQPVVNAATTRLDLSFLPKGVYFIKIRLEDRIQTEKILLQ